MNHFREHSREAGFPCAKENSPSNLMLEQNTLLSQHSYFLHPEVVLGMGLAWVFYFPFSFSCFVIFFSHAGSTSEKL